MKIIRIKENTSFQQPSINKMGNIRIISGQYRGRKLKVHDAEGLRPTTDRVKETLFNWLQFDIAGSRCLDLFSGSGSLSFESLSRYAKFVTLVELNVQSAKLIRENLDLLKISNAELVVGDALKFVQRVNQDEPYNIVFLDPPFRKGFLSQICSLLNKNAFLCNNALIYVEQEIENTAEMPSNWTLLKSKTAGQVSYSLYRNN